MLKFTFLLGAFIPLFAFAQAPQVSFAPKQYLCYRTSEKLQVNGVLDEAAWQAAEWTDTFVDIEGDLKPLPRQNTQLKMLWDDEYLYIGAVLEETDVWATITENESVIFRDNDFEIFIDPDGDSHNYCEFEINAFATTWDLLLVKPYRDGGPSLTSWDMDDLKAAVSVQGSLNDPTQKDTSWTVEIALPLHTLAEIARPRRLPQQGGQWRINFSRVQWQTEVKDGKYQKVINPDTGRPYPEDNWVWSPQGVINMHYPEMWGFVQFSEQSVQQQGDQFVFQQDEQIKWALRQIYYQQKAYRKQHGTYADNLDALSANIEYNEQPFHPSLETTSITFIAHYTDTISGTVWHINHEGKIWK